MEAHSPVATRASGQAACGGEGEGEEAQSCGGWHSESSARTRQTDAGATRLTGSGAPTRTRQEAEGTRQEAGGRRHEAGGTRQEARGRRHEAGGLRATPTLYSLLAL